MKRTSTLTLLITIAAWLLGTQTTQACGYDYAETFNYYIFRTSPYECEHIYSRSIRAALKSEWERYAHCTLTEEDMDALAELTPDKLFDMNHPVLRYVHNKQDTEMLTYLHLLARYLEDTQDFNNEWGYPDEEEMKSHYGNFRQMRTELQHIVVPGRLEARYQLLKMRLAYRLEDYNGCVNLWTQYRQKNLSNVFDRMTYGFYAGALFRQGHRGEAANAYAQLGDNISARLCLNSNTSAKHIATIAHSNANAEVLPVLIENFINSIQETHDYCVEHHDRWLDADENYVYGPEGMDISNYLLSKHSYARYTKNYFPWFTNAIFDEDDYDNGFIGTPIFPVYNQEVEAFLTLCDEMLSRSDLDDPALWTTARAYIYYMLGQHDKAWQTIKDVRQLKASTQRIAENARIIRMLIATTISDEAEMEQQLLDEMKWLMGRLASEKKLDKLSDDYVNEHASNCEFYKNILNRIIVHGIAGHYADDGKRDLAMMCYLAVEGLSTSTYNINYRFYEYKGVFYQQFSRMPFLAQKGFYDFLHNKSSLTDLQLCLRDMVNINDYDIRDYLGTRCILEGRWEEAITWLETIPVSYLKTQNIAPYAARRKWTNEQWFRHVKVDLDDFYDPDTYSYNVTLQRNAKVDFCRDVIRLQQELEQATGENRCQKAYQLATALFNASSRGDCWWLARYSVGMDYMYETDEYHKDPATAYDFVGEAQRLTSDALRTSDSRQKSRVLMARFYMQGEPPYDAEEDFYTDDVTYSFNYSKKSYRSYQNLRDFVRSGNAIDPRISRCDVLLRCMKLEN